MIILGLPSYPIIPRSIRSTQRLDALCYFSVAGPFASATNAGNQSEMPGAGGELFGNYLDQVVMQTANVVANPQWSKRPAA